MKKILCALLALTALSAVLAGCGKSEIKLYIGVSQKCSENTMLSEEQSTDIK